MGLDIVRWAPLCIQIELKQFVQTMLTQFILQDQLHYSTHTTVIIVITFTITIIFIHLKVTGSMVTHKIINGVSNSLIIIILVHWIITSQREPTKSAISYVQ